MKKMPLILIVLVLIIVGAGLIFSGKLNNRGPKATPTPTPEEEQSIEKLPEEALDVKFETRYDQRAFTLTISGLKEKGYTRFDYEASYDAQSTEDPTQIVSQGSGSTEPILVTDKPFVREILLGTCSKNVCKYDKGVKSVLVTLRLQTEDNKTKIWEKNFALE